MKHKITEQIEIPEGITCSYADFIFVCKKDSKELSKTLHAPGIDIKIKDYQLTVSCEKGNKKSYKIVKTFLAHIKNLFSGLDEDFIYKLETANVHFPMTTKVDANKLIINNFLGEKKPRHAVILPNVKVDIKGQKITISSPDKEAAGGTSANFEKATKVRGRDRRIFQDGIFIVEKPGRKI